MTTLRCDNTTGVNAAHAALRRLCQPAQVARLLHAVARQRGIEKMCIDDVRIERCWPGRDGMYLFEWSFEADGVRARLYGRCVPNETDGEVAGEHEPATSRSVQIYRDRPTLTRRIRCWQSRWRTTVFSSDRDPGLPHLSACLDPAEAIAVARLLPRGKALAAAELLAYKPGRRATIQYTKRSAGNRGAATHAAGKTFRDQRGARLLELHRQARSQLKDIGATLTVPAPLGYIKPLRLAVVEWIDVNAGGQRRLSTGDYVASLADLHRIEVDDLPTHTTDKECAVIRQWHEHLQIMRPADADRAWPLVAELCERGVSIGEAQPCVIHRDFYERQLLAGDKGPVLIDLDTLAIGDRCVDLGNLAAHLALSRLACGERVRSAPLCEEIADLYERCGHAVDRGRLAYFAAASMFRVAAVHAVRTATRRCSRPLIRLAAELMSVRRPSYLGAMT